MQPGVSTRKLTAEEVYISLQPPATHTTATTTMAFVALIVDAASRFATVYVPAQTWNEVVNILEDQGCEVVEDQTMEYEKEDFVSTETLNHVGVITIDQLLNNSNFIPNP